MAYANAMTRRLVWCLLCLTVLVFAGSVFIPRLVPTQERVYTLEDAYAGLQQEPHAWIGHTVTLQATLVGSAIYRLCPVDPRTIKPAHPPRCPDIIWAYLGPTTWYSRGSISIIAGWTMRPARTLASAPGMPAQELSVQIHGKSLRLRAPIDPLPTFLYRLPLVGPLLPRAPSLNGSPKVWRVQFLTPRVCRALHQTACPDSVSADL